MSKYILVMKSGYEQKVECDDRTFILQWEHTISNDNGGIVFNFNNGLMVNLLDVAMIKPFRDAYDFQPPPFPNGLQPRVISEGLNLSEASEKLNKMSQDILKHQKRYQT